MSAEADAARREFAARKMRFFDAIVRDTKLSRTDLAVCWALTSSFLNFHTGTAWPSADRLAKDLNLSERGVQRAIKTLVERGWWTITRGGGRGRSNEYRPVWELAPETTTTLSEKGDNPGGETTTVLSQNYDSAVVGIPLKNPTKEPLEGTRADLSAQSPDAEPDPPNVARQWERDPTNLPRQRELRVMANILNRRSRNDAERDLGNDLVRLGLDAEEVLKGGFEAVYRRAIDIEYGRPGCGVKYVVGACANAERAA